MTQLALPLEPAGVDPAVIAMVNAAIGGSLRHGIPSPIARILSGTKHPAAFGFRVDAEVEMFDGKLASVSVGRWCAEPDAWTHVFSRMDGGPAVLRRGRWVRIGEVVSPPT